MPSLCSRVSAITIKSDTLCPSSPSSGPSGRLMFFNSSDKTDEISSGSTKLGRSGGGALNDLTGLRRAGLEVALGRDG